MRSENRTIRFYIYTKVTCEQTTDVEMGSKEHKSEDDEDGPPPGWNTVISQKKSPSSPPTLEAVICGKSLTLLLNYFLPCPLSC